MTQGAVANIAAQYAQLRVITGDGPPVMKGEFGDAWVAQQHRDEDPREAACGAGDQDAHENTGRTCSLKSVSA